MLSFQLRICMFSKALQSKGNASMLAFPTTATSYRPQQAGRSETPGRAGLWQPCVSRDALQDAVLHPRHQQQVSDGNRTHVLTAAG